ncbi:MAG: phosphate regulon transcriptional regulator PhoB [Chromatiales bacterium]|jgi:two-component system phosphate regulon response regulator PhoB|nr:phosphate regulon transcriptional regulator PhoB [Chromatiales bacterium]
MIRLLLVEDEEPVREMLKFALADEDFEILEAADASEGFTALKNERPDLILLDWMLPGMSGIDFARRLRRDAASRGIPIILLTARAEENDKVQGLQNADDYITKPFSPRELKARIQAVLRRSTSSEDDGGVLQSDALCIDSAAHTVTAQGEMVAMGPTEFRLLHFFMSHPDRVYSREQLLDNVWGRNVYVEERTVDVHIRRLRKTLEPWGYDRCVQTVRAVGYRFAARMHS